MIELCVCIGTACHINGAYNVLHTFQQQIEEHKLHDRIALQSSFCMRECKNTGVGVIVNGKAYRVMPEGVDEFFRSVVLTAANG